MEKRENKAKKIKAPWPTKEVMEQIYALKLWGGTHSDFYSGIGSHQANIIQPYITAVTTFLTAFKNPLTVCDLGCGDFNIGRTLVKHTKKYVGVDIVADLIKRNRIKFKAENLEFQCLDIAVDHLPYGDCVLLRQVLQHLSNAEIQCIVPKLASYKYVIITEHIPNTDFVPNKDIISGQGIRLKKQSGLNVVVPPFNFEIKEERQLVNIVLNDDKGIIVTTLYTTF